MDAFDADVIIYAAEPDHPLGRRIAALFPVDPVSDLADVAGIGSLMLLTEVLSKPIRGRAAREIDQLAVLLSRLQLLPLDRAGAEVAATVAATYELQAADATHLATAISAGADRFVTDNRRDFPKTITEIDITYPEELPDPAPA